MLHSTCSVGTQQTPSLLSPKSGEGAECWGEKAAAPRRGRRKVEMPAAGSGRLWDPHGQAARGQGCAAGRTGLGGSSCGKSGLSRLHINAPCALIAVGPISRAISMQCRGTRIFGMPAWLADSQPQGGGGLWDAGRGVLSPHQGRRWSRSSFLKPLNHSRCHLLHPRSSPQMSFFLPQKEMRTEDEVPNATSNSI